MISITEFKDIVENNTKVTQQEAESIILPILKKIPVPIVTVEKDAYIERARRIDKSNGPFELSCLSYLPNHLMHRVEPGRFNKRSEPVFYGAFTDKECPHYTRYFLACELEQNLLNISDLKFRFTVSKWTTRDSFSAVLFIFDEKYCNNDQLKKVFDIFQGKSEYINLTDDEKDILKLITIELAKPNPVYGYIISNLIFDFYKDKNYGAIIYPGVQSKYRGNNIAIIPEFVDKYLDFSLCAEFELVVKENDIIINNLYQLELIDGKFKYFDIEENNQGNAELHPA